MKKLFDFQEKAIASINGNFTTYNSCLLISMMGTGKTVMAAALINQYQKQGKRCLFLVDLQCLDGQISKELVEWGIPFSIIRESSPYDSTLKVVVASAQTIESKVKRGAKLEEYLLHFDLIIIDEAHKLSYREICKLIRDRYSDSKVLGMTATPWRLNPEEYLGQWFDSTVETLQPPDLIKIGRSVAFRKFHFADYFDFDEIRVDKDGEWNEQDQEKQGMTTRNMQIVYNEWVSRCAGLTTIAFCSTVPHAIALTEYFQQQGVKAECITGATKNRDRLFESLSNGQITVLFSIRTLTAGFDCPCVAAVLYIKVSRSKSDYHQAVGRGSRPFPEKEYCYLLDFGANYLQPGIGNPAGYQDYYIGQKKGRARIKSKVCPGCGETLNQFLKICPYCGHVFEAPKNQEANSGESEYEDLELDLDLHMIEHFDDLDYYRLMNFRHVRKIAYQRNIHPDLAPNSFRESFGFLPPNDWYLKAILGRSPSKDAIAKLEEYLRQFAKNDIWFKVQMRLELGEETLGKKRKKKPEPEKEKKVKFSKSYRTWYNVLGVESNADVEEVKSAYRRLAMQFHPDINPTGERQMKEINLAYEQWEAIAKFG